MNLLADSSSSRFTEWQIWLQSLNLLADLVNLPADPPQQIYWLGDLVNLPVDPPSRFTDWQIWWQSLNLQADELTGRFGESAGRFLPQKIYWLTDLVNLPADSSPSRFTDWQIWWIYQQIHPEQIYWLADLVNLPADSPQLDLLSGRFGYTH